MHSKQDGLGLRRSFTVVRALAVLPSVYIGERLNSPGIIAKYTARLSIRLNIYMERVKSHPDHVNSNITG